MTFENTLKSFKWNTNNKTGYRKAVVVDLPLSPNSFNKYFRNRIPKIQGQNLPKISLELSVFDLIPVFGPNWYICQSPATSTQQRIFGMISMLYRPKYVTIFGQDPNR